MKFFYNTFLAFTVVSLFILGYVWYKDYSFQSNDLDSKVIQKIKKKEQYLKYLAYKHYGLKNLDIPVIISNRMQNSLFGLAAYRQGEIRVFLNKKRFQENEEYMIDHVLPHEYAHALMFVMKQFPKENGGHTKMWQNICLNLEGKKCDRFVKHKDILMGKLEPFY